VRVRAFLQEFIELPFDRITADEAAKLRLKYLIGTPDAAIIATGVVHKLPLITRDKALFKISEIDFFEL
jgi:predicted nucleic acid-binding protein